MAKGKLKKVRMGVIGVGGMGHSHAKQFENGKVPGAVLSAVCDMNAASMDGFGEKVKRFSDSRKLIRSGEVDAVLIATPHFAHTKVGIDALKQGLHVLVEKPISVHKADCEKLIAAHKKRGQIFSAMFQHRTDPMNQKIKNMITTGKLGKIVRVNWIITIWFRTETYYACGGWRATWAGEGGGVLLNQCPHQLDLLQWFCGMPSKVRAFCGMGKLHKIEVEDEVTAYLEYANGATGVFITSTGEAPGTDRLEICGDKGKLVVEGRKLLFSRNAMPTSTFCRTSKKPFARPKVKDVTVPYRKGDPSHLTIMKNFVDAIRKGEKLVAPGREGINSVELGNAMLYSSLTGEPVDMPLSGRAYARMLKKLISESTFVKKTGKSSRIDLSGSF